MPASKSTTFYSKRTAQTLDKEPEAGKGLTDPELDTLFDTAAATQTASTSRTQNTDHDENSENQSATRPPSKRPMQFALKHDAQEKISTSATTSNTISHRRTLRALLNRPKNDNADQGPPAIQIQDLSPVSTAPALEPSITESTSEEENEAPSQDDALLTQQTNDDTTQNASIVATPRATDMEDDDDDNGPMDLPDDNDDNSPLNDPSPTMATTPFPDELADSLTPPAAPPTNEEHDDLIPPSPPESDDDGMLDGGADYGMDDEPENPEPTTTTTTDTSVEEEEPKNKTQKKAPKSAMKKKKKKKRSKRAGDNEDDDDRRVSIDEHHKPPPRKKKKTVSRFTTTFSPKGIPLPREYEVIPVSDIKEKQGTPTPGLRRSKRARCKPLAYWKGEKAEYGPMSESAALSSDMMDMPEVKGYVYAKPTPHKPLKERPVRVTDTKKPGRKKTLAATEDLPSFDSSKLRKKYSYVDGEDALLWDDGVEESQSCKVVSHIANMESRKLPTPKTRDKSEGKVVGLAAQAFNQSNGPKATYVGYITGNLTLPSKGIKDAESVGGCAQVFTVVDCQPGALEVAYSDPEDEDDSTFNPDTAQRFLLEPRSMFRVPPGNTYRLCNHSKTTEAFLTWTIIRPVIQPQDVESESG